MNELQAYLATRLLAIDDYDSVKEVRRNLMEVDIAVAYYRATEDSIRRGGAACLRCHAQGHGGFQAH